MNEVTRILSAIEQGDPSAGAQLLPLVYDELRKLAAQKLAQEKPGRRCRRPPWFTKDMLALDDALTKLANTDRQAAELVKLRYFVGFTVPEAAAALGISPRSADFLWAYARTWLQKELHP